MSSTVAVKAFAEGVTQQIKDYLPEDYQDMECEILEQQKNNGVVLTGMILNMPGQQIAPVVYMEPFYDQVRKGEPMDQIMDRIADVCRQSLSVRELPETLDFTDYDSVKDHLTVQVINTKANQRMLSQVPHKQMINTKANQRMLSQVPHKQMEDLSVICRIEFPSPAGEGVGSVKVTHEMMSQWGVRPEVVYQKAVENAVKSSPAVLMSMDDLMMEMMGLPFETKNLLQLKEGEEFPKDGMYVLSNPMKLNGASVLAYPNLQEQLESVFPQGCYLLPSSLHEMIIIPKDIGMTPKEMGEMVRDVNQKEVARDEILSDRVYEFDKEKRQLRQIPESIEKVKEMER